MSRKAKPGDVHGTAHARPLRHDTLLEGRKVVPGDLPMVCRSVIAIAIPPEASMTKRLDFVEDPAWEVGPLKDLTVFFSNLEIILPEDAVLFLEGTSMAQVVKEFLASRALPEPEDLELGEGHLGDRPAKERTFKVPFGGELRIFPRGSRFHIAALPDNHQRLAELSGRHPQPEMFDSLVAYRAEKALLHWYDPPTDPFNVSTEIDEARLRLFCDNAQVGYRMVD